MDKFEIFLPTKLNEIGVKKEEMGYYSDRIMRNPEAANLSKENIMEILNHCFE